MYKKKLILIILVILLVGVAMIYVQKSRRPQTAQTNEINNLLNQAGISKIDDWAVYSDCGPTDRFEGYALMANNVAIESEQVDRLRTSALRKNYNVVSRTDGYAISNDIWDIIVLSKDRPNPAMFITVHLDEKPEIFPVASEVCG